MKSAGIAIVDKQMIVAVLIDSGVHIYHVKSLNEARDILETAKPEVVGMDESTAQVYEDVKFMFNTVKIRHISKTEVDSICDSLTMLNITKDTDKPAIVAASLALNEKDQT